MRDPGEVYFVGSEPLTNVQIIGAFAVVIGVLLLVDYLVRKRDK